MHSIYISAIIIFLFSCGTKKVADPSEVFSLLQHTAIDSKMKNLSEEIDFWNQKLKTDPGNFVYVSELAGLQLEMFQSTGNIAALQKADSMMVESARALNFNDPDMLQAMAQLSVTKHHFAEAFRFNEEARKKSASPFAYSLIRFDADMELGRYQEAEKSLQSISNSKSFHYLIRKARQKDHQGDLEGAILIMEDAFDKIRRSDNTSLYCWTLSNLGDMYGHAGRIEDSYKSYLSVLRKDPTYLYALKGIAWIAYSHDRNSRLARELTDFIMKYNSSPDHYLFLAELAEFEGKYDLKAQLQNTFIQQVSQPGYGDMYNKYLIELFSEDPKRIDEAFRLAEKEVSSRSTPETFSWLAWVHYKKGNYQEAARLFQNHVMGMTSEPEPLLKGFYILREAGEAEEAAILRNELFQAEYELGPLSVKGLRNKME